MSKVIVMTKGELISMVSDISDNYMSKSHAIRYAMELTLGKGNQQKEDKSEVEK